MDVLDASGDLERARERQAHVAHRDGHGVAVDDDQAALGVGDEPRAVVVAVRDARHGVRHVEVHEHERRRDGLHVALALARERRAFAGLDRLARRARREGLARPDAERVVAAAALCREPAAVVRDEPLALGLRLVERHESHRHLRVVGERLEHALEIVEILERLAADAGHDAAARYRGLAEHVTGIRDVDAGHGAVEMPRLLIREIVEHAVAVLDVLGGRDRVQILDHDAVLEPLPAALDDDRELSADGAVEDGRERHELRRSACRRPRRARRRARARSTPATPESPARRRAGPSAADTLAARALRCRASSPSGAAPRTACGRTPSAACRAARPCRPGCSPARPRSDRAAGRSSTRPASSRRRSARRRGLRCRRPASPTSRPRCPTRPAGRRC